MVHHNRLKLTRMGIAVINGQRYELCEKMLTGETIAIQIHRRTVPIDGNEIIIPLYRIRSLIHIVFGIVSTTTN